MQGKMSLSVFSLSHLAVDFSCFFVLMGAFYTDVSDVQLISLGFLIYNAIAFALQLPFGSLADALLSSRSRLSAGHIAALGCLLVALGVICPLNAWARLALCALGNALFHTGGGIDSLVLARGRYARSGIFISFGALGVALGTLASRAGTLSPWLVALLLVGCIILILRFCLQKSPYETSLNNASAKINTSGVVILLCAVAILVRAAAGAYTPVPWKNSSDPLFVLAALAVFSGKFAGGLLADRFAPRTVATASLLISAPLLAFGNGQIIVCCLGLFLFNVTTAVSLCVIASQLPRNPGLSFGLTTLALFLGSSLSFFWALPESLRPALTLLFVAAAALCLFLSAPRQATGSAGSLTKP
ncbi:MAG: hypothetical protein LBP91_05200 [Coriobacteriales bacterium]|jgi:FSR family fosmidomycin resistance protein-like MFS transporter|nr:hypothetical protein [Coriobacteriales bacterium]